MQFHIRMIFAAVLMGLGLTLAGGCASAPEALVPPMQAVARPHPGSVAVSVNQFNDRFIGTNAFRTAVERSIANSKLFDSVRTQGAGGGSDYRLEVTVQQIAYPDDALFTTKMLATWRLSAAPNGTLVWKKDVLSADTEPFEVGAVELAAEGAVRNNIRRAIESLSKAEFPAP